MHRFKVSNIVPRIASYTHNFPRNSIRKCFSSVSSPKEQLFTQQETDIYYGDNRFPILMMFGATILNGVVWSGYLANQFIFAGQSIQGIELTGNPTLGVIGALATGAMVYASQSYASHSVQRAYVSADGERIGFQLYTILGKPGRKIEAKIGNVRLVNLKGSFLTSSSSQIPLRVKGVKFNVLINSRGIYLDREKLDQILAMGETEVAADHTLNQHLKEQRVNTLKDQHQQRKQKQDKSN